MNSIKKLLISVGWILVVLAAIEAFSTLRGIGTTWMNSAGFFRLVGLSLFGLACVVTPLILAALVWFGQPANFYKKLAK